MLDTEAITPWRYTDWIFPRASPFAAQAGPIRDRYAGLATGPPLGPKDHSLRAEEQTSIPARRRGQPSLPAARGRAAYIAHEYERGGALQ
jgi:hypothetical protein